MSREAELRQLKENIKSQQINLNSISKSIEETQTLIAALNRDLPSLNEEENTTLQSFLNFEKQINAKQKYLIYLDNDEYLPIALKLQAQKMININHFTLAIGATAFGLLAVNLLALATAQMLTLGLFLPIVAGLILAISLICLTLHSNVETSLFLDSKKSKHIDSNVKIKLIDMTSSSLEELCEKKAQLKENSSENLLTHIELNELKTLEAQLQQNHQDISSEIDELNDLVNKIEKPSILHRLHHYFFPKSNPTGHQINDSEQRPTATTTRQRSSSSGQ